MTTNKTFTDGKASDVDHGNPTHPSPNEAKFTQVVKALLAENHTHHDLKWRLYQLVMEEAQKLPPIKVLISASHRGFGISESFITFVHSHTKITNLNSESAVRWDPVLIQAISDYGRYLCDKYPFILDDMRAVYALKLDKLLADPHQLPTMTETEFDPDLVAEAVSFAKQMTNSRGVWRENYLSSFQNSSESTKLDLEVLAEKHPDFWMSHCSMSGYLYRSPTFRTALRFAHVLSQGGNPSQYHGKPDEAQDAAIYECIGLCGANGGSAKLAISEIPAQVDFSILLYDGLESVDYHCGGGNRILDDVEYVV